MLSRIILVSALSTFLLWSADPTQCLADDPAHIARLLMASEQSTRLERSPEAAGLHLITSWNRGPAHAVAAENDIVYTNCGNYFTIFDCASTPNPVLLGERLLSNAPIQIALAESHAYLAMGLGGLQVLDVSNPVSPDPASSYATDPTSYVDAVTVHDGLAYLTLVSINGTTLERYLVSIDVSDPGNPTVLDSLSGFDPSIGGIAVLDSLAYIPDNGSLRVINVSRPDFMSFMPPNPVVIGEEAYGIALRGDFGYIVCDGDSLYVIDLSDPAVPQPASACAPPWEFDTEAIALAGDFALVATGSSVLYFDVSDPFNCSFGGFTSIWVQAQDIVTAGDLAYAAGGDDGLVVLDNAQFPAGMSIAGAYNMPGRTRAVDSDGTYIYVANGLDGLRIFDGSAAYLSSFPTGGIEAEEVAVRNGFAYLGIDNTLCTIDVSDPYHPHQCGYLSNPTAGYSEPNDIVFRGDTAYVAWQDYGLAIFDLSDPCNLTEIGADSSSRDIRGVALKGNLAYLAAATDGLRVVDISDPTAPHAIGSCEYYGRSQHIAVKGDYAYIADEGVSIIIIDISDPFSTDSVSSYQSVGEAEGIAVYGDTLYLADALGLKMFDIQNPSNPQLLCAFLGGQDGNDVNVSADGSKINFADNGSGFYVFTNSCVSILVQNYSATIEDGMVKVKWKLAEQIDTAELTVYRRDGRNDRFVPLIPTMIEMSGNNYSFSDAGYPPGSECTYRVIWKKHGKNSILFEVTVNSSAPALPVTLYQNHPNPFNPSTQIRYYLPERARVQLAVYDVNGKKVVTLVDGVRNAGYHNEIWTGLDGSGRQSASGVYFCRLHAGKKNLSSKMILLR